MKKRILSILLVLLMVVSLAPMSVLAVSDSGDNDSAGTAQSFTLGDTISGQIAPEKDVDYYKFTLTESGRVTLDITSYIKYYTLEIYDTDGKELWYSDYNRYNDTVGFREDVHTIDLEAGVYYLKVTGYSRGTADASTGNYTITFGDKEDGKELHIHSYSSTVTDPTCTAQGYTTHICSCGESYKDNYTSALGHNYSNGKCSRCGAADTGYKPASSFVDVPSTSYCYDEVHWAVGNGITNGTDSTHFSPNAGCTRGQVVTFLWRAAGEPNVSANVNFVDVSTSSVYYKAIKWAVANGITKGTDAKHFSPNATCTRGQVVTFMYRAAGETYFSGMGSFVDVSYGSYCYSAVQWAVANGITKGTDSTHFSPNATCTRGQVVTFLYRAQ